MNEVQTLEASAAGAPLTRSTTVRRNVGPGDVAIDILFCGVCHSDIHQARDEWGDAIFPMVPGHEIVGVVTAVGDSVSQHAVGDRVGVGVFVDSCRECANCRRGDEQYCVKGEVGTYNGREYDGTPTAGGYSTAIVVAENYVLKIPEALPSDAAAPLLCAGVTVWSPLRRWNIGPGKKVAILGMGGLGHLAVKFAHALGAEVTVLSQTLSKKQDGLRMGADYYYATSDPETFETQALSFDLILNTVAVNLDVEKYLGLLSLNGALVHVGIPTEADSMKMMALAEMRRSVAGSKIGSIRENQEMLDFCAEHGIVADIEIVGVDHVNDAFERVIKSDVRYRFVVDIKSFNDPSGSVGQSTSELPATRG